MRRKFWLTVFILTIILAAAYIVIALLAKPAASLPVFENQSQQVLVIAHRGGKGLWPEETLFAFDHAVRLGVDWLEMDLHSTADGALVLMHDDTVDRTTDGTGALTEMTLAQVQELDAGYNWMQEENDGPLYPYRGQGIRVPTLDEVFTAFPDIVMNIEIKQSEPLIGGVFCEKIRQYGRQDKVVIASFETEAIQDFRHVCPEIATSSDRAETTRFFIFNALLLGPLYSPSFQAVQVPEYNGDLHVLTPWFVNGTHARRLQVHAWTINEIADMQRMIDLGVDGIITDYPDRLLELIQR